MHLLSRMSGDESVCWSLRLEQNRLELQQQQQSQEGQTSRFGFNTKECVMVGVVSFLVVLVLSLAVVLASGNDAIRNPAGSQQAFGPLNSMPTPQPAVVSTLDPAVPPTFRPMLSPTFQPVATPTLQPVTTSTVPLAVPATFQPVLSPTSLVEPTPQPMMALTRRPSVAPTPQPVVEPTPGPVVAPTRQPVVEPTRRPVVAPTRQPVVEPTRRPVVAPTEQPVKAPSLQPVVVTQSPTRKPTRSPIGSPTVSPTEAFVANTEQVLSVVNDKAFRRVEYPADSTPEERALKWLIEADPAMSQNSVSSHQIMQRFVLATFWFQSNTPVLRNWMTAASECIWEGIRECDANGVIIHLYFENFGLQGSIPPDLGALTEGLQNLDIDGNLFTGTIPTTLGFLTKLTRLDLGPNYLEGTVPTELARLVNLEFADFRDNSLTGTFPSFVTSWTRLQRTLWYNNELEGSVPFDCSIEFLDLVVDCDKVMCPCCTHCCPLSEGPIPSYDDACDERCTCTPTKIAP